MKHLDGDTALDNLVHSLEDGAHSALAKLADDTVRPNHGWQTTHGGHLTTSKP